MESYDASRTLVSRRVDPCATMARACISLVIINTRICLLSLWSVRWWCLNDARVEYRLNG